MGDLSPNVGTSESSGGEQQATTYASLFIKDPQPRCLPDAPQASTGPLAYLVDLKKLVDTFENKADKSVARLLGERRPDLLKLNLDETSLKNKLPALRVVTDVLKQQVSSDKNSTPEHTVATATYPTALPFHYAWESIKATLAKKNLAIWDVVRVSNVQDPNFTLSSITLKELRDAIPLSSGFSPVLRALLVADPALDQNKEAFYKDHFNETGDDPLVTLSLMPNLAKALGLTQKKLRETLALGEEHDNTSVVTSFYGQPSRPMKGSSADYGAAFINSTGTPLFLIRDAATHGWKIGGITLQHLDRLQRIVRLQRALGVSPAETDVLVMSALQAEGQKAKKQSTEEQVPEAPKKDFHLTDSTLRALGLFCHLRQKYGVNAHQFAALIHEISIFGIGRKNSFYDKLFNTEALQNSEGAGPVLKLDNKAFADDLTVTQLCLGLQVDEAPLRMAMGLVCTAQKLEKPVRSCAFVSACYRLLAYPRLFGVSPQEGMLALMILANENRSYITQLAGVPSLSAQTTTPDIVDVLVGVMSVLGWVRQRKLSMHQMFATLLLSSTLERAEWESFFNEGADIPVDEKALLPWLQKWLGLVDRACVIPLLGWVGTDAKSFIKSLQILNAWTKTEAQPSRFTEEDLQRWANLESYSALIKLFKLSASSIRHFVAHPAWFSLERAKTPSLTTLYQLSHYQALLAALPESTSEDKLIDYFKAMNASKAKTPTQAKAFEDLEKLLGRLPDSLANISRLKAPSTLAGIAHLMRLLELAERSGVSVDALLEMSTLKDANAYDDFQSVATILKKSCSLAERKEVQATRDEGWRDALVQWLLVHWVPTDRKRVGIRTRQALADYLLIDLKVAHEPMTTRVASATTSLQRYLEQLQTRREPGYKNASVSESECDNWCNYNCRYDRWKMRRELQSEPQNFIDPTCRQRKTEAFETLASLLAQDQCSADDIQVAMLGYLSTFEKLSNIQPVSAYADGTDPMTDTYHFIGKTNVEPQTYYWRTLDMSQRDESNAPSMLAWGEWEAISLSLGGAVATTPLSKVGEDERVRVELIRPVVIAGRRYVVWVERDATGIALGPDKKPSEYYALRVCYAFQQTDGLWSPSNEFLCLDGHNREGKLVTDRLMVPTAVNGTAEGNPFLKTLAFEPGLMVMVNNQGDRAHDPWLTVLLYDVAAKEKSKNNVLNANNEGSQEVDYFFIVRDLLLVEDKELGRAVEKATLNNWLNFFGDPRVVQHRYVGSIVNLELDGDARTALSQENFKAMVWDYEVVEPGELAVGGELAGSRESIDVSVKMSTLLGSAVIFQSVIIDGPQATKFELCFQTLSKKEINDPEVKCVNIRCKAFQVPGTPTHNTSYHDICIRVDGNVVWNFRIQGDAVVEEAASILKANLSKPFSAEMRWGYSEPITGRFTLEPVGPTTDVNIKVAALLTWVGADNANLALSSADNRLLAELGLTSWVDDKKNANSLTKFNREALGGSTTRWSAGKANEATRERSVACAIAEAVASNKTSIVDSIISDEVVRVQKKVSFAESGKSHLEKLLRLKYLYPEAYARIFLRLDPTHGLHVEGTMAGDGSGQVVWFFPINLDVSEYTVALTCFAGSVDTNNIVTVTKTFKLSPVLDDAVASVWMRYNTQQVHYLDMSEVNSKHTEAQPVNSIRLNTLFGKHLVARATQSVDRVLSWETQSMPEPPLEPGSSPGSVDFCGANGMYFWELFFHVPFLVAWRLRQARQYKLAWRWISRYLFDPYRTDSAQTGRSDYWLSRPITGPGAFSPSEELNNPDLLAYANPECYRKALHLFVVEFWRREGDDLYRQLTHDSLAQAGLCYDKALRLIGPLTEQISGAPQQSVTLAKAAASMFVQPVNTALIQLRKLLRHRLSNLRHGLTIDGKPLPVLLYAQAEPYEALGSQHRGTGMNGASGVAPQVPAYRYKEVRPLVDAAIRYLIDMGRQLFRTYEAEFDTSLAVMQQANIIKLSDFTYRLQCQAVEAARRGKDTLLLSKRMTQQRLDYYNDLVDEGIQDLEHVATVSAATSQGLLTMAALFDHVAGALKPVPNIFGMAAGGADFSGPPAATAASLKVASGVLELAKDELRIKAEYQLRDMEWRFQMDQAQLELQCLDSQLAEQEIQIRSAQIAREEIVAIQAVQREEYIFMTTGFAISPTYVWMIANLSDIYAAAYDAVISLCLSAQASWQYETGDFHTSFIKPGAWQDGWRGMQAGEALQRDLLEMDAAFIHRHERRMHIHKDISLKELLGDTLGKRVKGNKINFDLGSRLFDRDFPGHYLRKIVKVSLSIKVMDPDSAGPVAAILTQATNKLLIYPDLGSVNQLYSPDGAPSNFLMRELRPKQQIAVWATAAVVGDYLLYKALFDEGRYLPFEGTGAISSWVLEFTGDAGLPDIDDITVHLDYTAAAGDSKFSTDVQTLLEKTGGDENG